MKNIFDLAAKFEKRASEHWMEPDPDSEEMSPESEKTEYESEKEEMTISVNVMEIAYQALIYADGNMSPRMRERNEGRIEGAIAEFSELLAGIKQGKKKIVLI